MKKLLWMGVIASLLLFFLIPGSAMATRVELTLGWHNLGNEFFLLSSFNEGEVIKSGKLKGATLGSHKQMEWTDFANKVGSNFSDDDALVVENTGKKFDKFIAKVNKKALKKAAKKYQKDAMGTKKGWKNQYKIYNSDPWSFYKDDPFVSDAFDSLFNKKKINANILGGKYKLKLVAFANPIDEPPTATQVPEPATMLLLGIGLLGTSIVGRKIRKKA